MTTKENDMYLLNHQQGSKAVQKLYLKDAKNNDAEFVRSVKLATRSCNEIDSLRDPS